LYRQYGIDYTLQVLDGVFAFVLIDYRLTNDESKIYVARDPYGVRPLYQMESEEDGILGFASELKVLHEEGTVVQHFAPGSYSSYSFSHKTGASWTKKSSVMYHQPGFQSFQTIHNDAEILKGIRHHLTLAVEKRCQTTERPIACLLSGGLDSSLITALVNDYMNRHGFPPVETYSIGLAGSTDLAYARQVSDYLGTRHTEIFVTEKELLDAIPEVIQAIESYDTTTVRASLGNYLLGKYIAVNTTTKIIFNGDGYDELAGNYLYMSQAPNALEFDKESRRLLQNIHAFDILRSDKCFSSHGLEMRAPFLDHLWVQYYVSIPATCRLQEKWIPRAFNATNKTQNHEGKPFLPDELLFRRKEAFSDDVWVSKILTLTLQNLTPRLRVAPSSVKIIQEYVENILHTNSSIRDFAGTAKSLFDTTHLLPTTAEQFYYRMCFEEHYRGQGHVVPYFSMPRWVDAKS
jgi:asparagine synthase (glutamine-hydrolysing)